MEAFAINNKESFFGREKVISRLMSSAKRGDCLQIIGSRRFGKTCIMEECYQRLLVNKSFNIIPVYIDTKTDDIKGDIETFEYIISKLLTSMFEYNGIIDSKISDIVSIDTDTNWVDIYENFEKNKYSKQRLHALLKNVIISTDKKILFLIDEYEYLLTTAFSTPVSFMPLREIASNLKYGFSFWVAGAVSWGVLSESIGSGELNICSESANENLKGISKDKFTEMWQYECSHIEDEKIKSHILKKCDYTFEKTGGIPFYGKIMGQYLLNNKSECDYTVFSSYFNDIIRGLSEKEVEYLKEMSKHLTFTYNGNTADNLIRRGLITKINTNECRYTIPLLKEYVYSLTISDQSESNTNTPQTITLAKKIVRNIELINEEYKNKRRKFLLDPINGASSAEDDLSSECLSDKEYKVFSTTLYTFWYERIQQCSEKIVTQKYDLEHSTFVKIIDTNRHTLGGAHLSDIFKIPNKQKHKRMEKDKMLEMLVGTKNEPCIPSDYKNLQLAILNLFDKEVTNLLKDVRNMR
ncbi:MAG: hypothetical protein IKP73_04385 [Bacteroidales bacterium]|nr:hypothetical protein [Bacteroidales bacterium]